MSNRYILIKQHLNSRGKLIPVTDDPYRYVEDFDKDYYTSIFQYSEEHFKEFEKTGSVAGISDVVTNTLAFDFDCKDDLEKARQDALALVSRLREKLGVKRSQVELYFSGMKGFTIVTKLDKLINPDQAAHLAINVLGQGLPTLDKSLYNASRVLRLPNTRHKESGLFKIALSYNQLEKLRIETLKEQATKMGPGPVEAEPTTVPEEFLVIPEVKRKVEFSDLEFSKKPAQWKNCKWSLAQGNFKGGERHSALMVLASTCRGLGFTKEMTYDLCKGALRRSIEKYGQGTTNKEELYKNIIEDSIFTDNWEGGQYTCKKPGFLQSYCDSLGEHKCKDRDQSEKPFVKFDEMADRFFKFAEEFEKNVIKTGIVQLDENVLLSTSTLNGLLGQPGAGKTTMALNYLKYSSKNGIPSAFFSLDMGEPIVTAKIIQQRTGMSFKEAAEFCKTQREPAKVLVNTILREDYANVNFNYRSGLTCNDMKELIKQQEEVSGQKIRLVIIDYLECLAGPYSDPTANTGFIANQLKDLANELGVCILLLLQTQKHSTPDISDPLLTLKGVKGSSIIEQSCTTILTLWREGYNPKYTEQDRYISFAVVKNRFGGLWTGDFSWDPVRGEITSLTEEQEQEFKEFKDRKKKDKLQAAEEGDKQWQN